MACLVSTTLSLPLSASHSSTMEMRPRNLSLLVRLSCQPISEAAAKPSASSSANKAIPRIGVVKIIFGRPQNRF